jgi:hypothetical protein
MPSSSLFLFLFMYELGIFVSRGLDRERRFHPHLIINCADGSEWRRPSGQSVDFAAIHTPFTFFPFTGQLMMRSRLDEPGQ